MPSMYLHLHEGIVTSLHYILCRNIFYTWRTLFITSIFREMTKDMHHNSSCTSKLNAEEYSALPLPYLFGNDLFLK